MNPLATDNLAELIRKKHQILVQLRDIGLRQAKLAEEGSANSVLQLMGAKQHLINALQLVERHLRPFQSENPDSRVWRTPEDRARCAAQSEACNLLLAEVVDLERQQERRMIEQRDLVAGDLKRANSAQQAAGAYNQHRVDPRPPARATHSTHYDPHTPTLHETYPAGRLDVTSDAT